MTIQLTNTLTRRKEPFVPADPSRVTMYVCGPTVYNYAHIGNMRPPVVFDVLFRLLRHTYGEDAVLYARNYTDIDDRIIKAAIEGGKSIAEITRPFEHAYESDTSALGVLSPTFKPRATEHVEAMIALIEKLIANGKAYKVGTGVYFAVSADEDYGKLSGRAQEDLQAGARVEGEDDKRHPSDFALWKAATPGEPRWDAPFGAGRPGWHIECSAMIEAELGSPIDIHGGGIDLVFPHHENEIAQSESAHNHPLSRIWMHNGFLTMDTTKMSKSIGNVITPRELLEQGWQGETLRWALLSTHYRAPLDFSTALLKQSKETLDRLYRSLLDANALIRKSVITEYPTPEFVLLDRTENVVEALRDDLNTPKANAELATLATELRVLISRVKRGEIDSSRLVQTRDALLRAGEYLGVLQEDPETWFQADVANRRAIETLIKKRDAAREQKDWRSADVYRDRLKQNWVTLRDSKGAETSWSLDRSEEAVLNALEHWARLYGGVVDKSIRIADRHIDALISVRDEQWLVEHRTEIRSGRSLELEVLQRFKDVRNLLPNLTRAIVVAPDTSENRQSVGRLASGRRRVAFLLIDGLGSARVWIAGDAED